MHFLHSMYSCGIPVFLCFIRLAGRRFRPGYELQYKVLQLLLFPLFFLSFLCTPWTKPFSFGFHCQAHTSKMEPFNGALKKINSMQSTGTLPKYSTFYTKVAFKKYSQARLVGIAVT